MGDAGEGLIDAEDRFQQWVAEREQQKQRKGVASADPERERKLNSLRLAKAELERQRQVTTSPIRRDQIGQALAELESQMKKLGAPQG
jgi:endonuclease YncB( thermonuclease family)